MINLKIEDKNRVMFNHQNFVANDKSWLRKKLTEQIKLYTKLSEYCSHIINDIPIFNESINSMPELKSILELIFNSELKIDEKKLNRILDDAKLLYGIRKKDFVHYNNDLALDILSELKSVYYQFLIICRFLESNLIGIAIGDIQQLQTIQHEFLKKVLVIDNSKLFCVFHEELKKIFSKAYEKFTEIDKYTEIILENKKRGVVKWNAYEYIRALNVIVCPYCNANPIPTVELPQHLFKAGKMARPALDHFIPKSIFPIFSVSIYNLIPSCTYCNSSFKRDFYASFTNCFSPLANNIDGAFKFEIVARGEAENSFLELLKEKVTLYTPEETHYMKLLGLSEITKVKSNLDSLIQDLNSIELKVIKQASKLAINIVNTLEELLGDLKQDFNEYYNCKINFEDNSKVNCESLVKKYQQLKKNFILLINETSVGTKVTTEVKKAISHIRDILSIILSNNFFEYEMVENDEFNFTDVYLGESSDFAIKISPNQNLSKEDRVKVLHNVSLFQLEALYQQFKPFINQKIKQSYYVNTLYKANLLEMFPTWLDEEYVNGFTDNLFFQEENFQHNMLGKLTLDLIKPAVAKEERINFVF